MYVPTGKELIDPIKLLEAASIRDGMTVADFGCGTLGHYVFLAAKMVGQKGKVYAVDILKSVLAGVESRMKMEAVTNVETVWGDLERMHGIKLANESSDLGLLINNIFLSKQKELMVKESVRMIKRGGKMVFVDWKIAGASFGPDPATRVSIEEMKKLAEGAGLTFEKEYTPGPYHYGLVYVK